MREEVKKMPGSVSVNRVVQVSLKNMEYLDNYDVLNLEQKNELWKLVLRKVTMFRGETKGPLRIKLYPNLPQ